MNIRRIPSMTMRLPLVAFVVFCTAVSSHGQALNRSWTDVKNTVTDGGEETRFNKIALDASGNAFTAGTTYDGRTSDWIIRKLVAATGVVQWERRITFPGTRIDPASNGVAAIIVDGAGNPIVTGTISVSNSRTDMNVLKLSGTDGSTVWEERYDGAPTGYDGAQSIAVDASNNVIVAGYSHVTISNSDLIVIKYGAATGSVFWTHRYNGPANSEEGPRDVKVDAGGNVLITGYSRNGSGTDIYTAKYSGTDGATLWEKRYAAGASTISAGYRLALDSAGNAFVAGMTKDTYSDGLTLKYAAADGALLWEAVFVGTGLRDDVMTDIVVDATGDAVVLGRTRAVPSNSTVTSILKKYSGATGLELWTTSDPGVWPTPTEDGDQLELDSAGDVIVTGKGYDSSSFDRTVTGKYSNSSGVRVWQTTYALQPASLSVYEGYAVKVDASGNVIVASIASNPDKGSLDHLTLKYSSTGVLLWNSRYDGTQNRGDGPGAIVVDSKGNAISAGYAGDYRGYRNIHVWKNDAVTGARLWEQRYDFDLTADEESAAVAVDASDNVYVAGNSGTAIYLAKYASATGAVIWQKRVLPSGNSDVRVRDIAVDSVGNVFITGSSRKTNANRTGFYTGKFSTTGTVVWQQYHETFNADNSALDIALDAAGNALVMGRTDDSLTDGMVTLKYAAANGAKLWEKVSIVPITLKAVIPSALDVDPAGNAVVCGTSEKAIYTAKLESATGNVIWEKTYLPPGTLPEAHAGAITTDNQGNVIVGGFQRSARPLRDTDMLTIKYASADGIQLWLQAFNGAVSGSQYSQDGGSGVVVDGAGNVWALGYTQTSFTNTVYGTVTAKYAATNGAVLGTDIHDSRITDQQRPFYDNRLIATGGGCVAISALSKGDAFDTDAFAIAYRIPLQAWKLQHLGNANASDTGDPDEDGLKTLAEYGLLLDPGKGDVNLLPSASVRTYTEGRRLAISFQRDPARNDVIIEVQTALSPGGPWDTIASSINGGTFSGGGFVGETDASGGLKNVEVRDAVGVPEERARFLRLRVRN